MLNKVHLIGRVGSDAEKKIIKESVSVIKFSIATSTSKKVNNEWKQETQWHRCSMFVNKFNTKSAETLLSVAKKGKLMYVEGQLKYAEWERQGVKTEIAGIQVSTYKLLEKKDTTTSTEF